MAKQDVKEPVVVLLIEKGDLDSVLDELGFVLDKVCSGKKYAVIWIENDDIIPAVLRDFDPLVFVSSEEYVHMVEESQYNAPNLVGRLCQRYRKAWAILTTTKKLDGNCALASVCEGEASTDNPRILYFQKPTRGFVSRSGLERVIKQAFGAVAC